MVQAFFTAAVLLIISIGAMFGHYLYKDTQLLQDHIQKITILTKGSTLSFSTAYYEPRIAIQTSSNPAYPQMQTINRMDFIYAK